MARVSKIDDATIFSNPNLQSGLMANASAEALQAAASNQAGAMAGFVGMNMANQAGVNMMGAVNQNASDMMGGFTSNSPEPGTIFGNSTNADNTSSVKEEANVSGNKFCPNCGSQVGDFNFCTNCGHKLK